MKTTTLRKALVSGAAAVSVIGLATPAVFADGGNNYNSYGSGNRNSYSSSYGKNSNNRHCNTNNNKGKKKSYGNNNWYNNASYRSGYGQRW